MAPFWTDSDISEGVGEVSYQVYDNSQSESLSWVSTYVSQQQQINFIGTWMLVAEWRDVPKHQGELTTVGDETCYRDVLSFFSNIVFRQIPIKQL